MQRNIRSSGTVRITGGYLRGRVIRTPGGKTHPMGERERIALFNMLQGIVPGSRVADLYCGGGTLGIEALSRGAKMVCFVDNDPRALVVLGENLRELDLKEALDRSSQAVKADLAGADVEIGQYELVIADPPYDRYDEKMVAGLPKLVSPGGTLVLSHPGEAPELENMTKTKSRRYAGATISFYTK